MTLIIPSVDIHYRRGRTRWSGPRARLSGLRLRYCHHFVFHYIHAANGAEGLEIQIRYYLFYLQWMQFHFSRSALEILHHVPNEINSNK